MPTETKLFNHMRAFDVMKKFGLDAIIATSPENVHYATGFVSNAPFCFRDMVFFAVASSDQNQTALVVPKGEICNILDHVPWTSDIVLYGDSTMQVPLNLKALDGLERGYYNYLVNHGNGHDEAVEAFDSVLRTRGLQEGRIGFDERGVAPHILRRIRNMLPKAELIDAFQIWREIRAIKTAPEVNKLREAARRNEAALRQVYESVRVGADQGILQEIYHRNLVENGASFRYWDAGLGTQSSTCFPFSPYKAQLKDLVRVDAACTLEYYYSDTGRTLILGAPNEKKIKYFEAIHAGIKAGLNSVKPGVATSDVFHTIMEAVAEAGIPHHTRTQCGHGIGLEFYEIPLISPSKTRERLLLEEGMVLNLETPYYELGFGGIQIEETVVVTNSGCERLTQESMDLIVC